MSEAPYEVDTDGGDVRLGVSIVGETQEQTRLSDTRVTDKQQLEQIVVSGNITNEVSVGPSGLGSEGGSVIKASAALSNPDSVSEKAQFANQDLIIGVIHQLLLLGCRHGG